MTWSTSGKRVAGALAAAALPVSLMIRQKEKNEQKNGNFKESIKKSKELVKAAMTIQGIPGMSVAVSIDGKMVWKAGFGYSNLETLTKCTGDDVMRIASISKPVTAALTAQLVENGALDLDKNIREYLPEFPAKKFDGKEVEITMRQLLSHSAGIRHYGKPKDPSLSLEDPRNNNTSNEEFLSNKKYKSSLEALEIFKNDDLVNVPGTKFSYTTYGLTLAGAVLEKSSGKSYRELANQLFYDLGMRNTHLDTKEKIIRGRVSYYHRNRQHIIENCPEVDCSNKFAGGGIISNVTDLLVFANAVLYSTQTSENDALFKKETISKFLTKQIETGPSSSSGLGWFLVDGGKNVKTMENVKTNSPYFYHTGAAVGASSVLLISPGASDNNDKKNEKPNGICVAILCNMQDVSVLHLGKSIRDQFLN